ncbi:hypothetical protein DKM44_00395 [Deinococcus irradiatisoli]|uniref:DUF1802 domain-containing protein n=1 Tax=Deinococcus irradiatisoli TaxID=2202254 RepID=A0A2Z3JA75_9DEIO|nr:DUF1802 family protein [Deinococcus irradiatisoli]AWN21885.1 hypothetical protein DKM44_00395 [Deinococcus irradiatisoli]
MTFSALKEWDAQVQALARGQTAVVVRKGGILETHGGFEVEHRRFLLYPTFLHQNPAELRGDFQPLLRPDPSPGQIVLPALAEVQDLYKIESLDAALALEDLQALNAGAIERRFHYRQRPWLHALVLRVWPLTSPLALEETPEMLGCVSWVSLPENLDVELGAPSLPEADLTVLRKEVKSRLGLGALQ